MGVDYLCSCRLSPTLVLEIKHLAGCHFVKEKGGISEGLLGVGTQG